MNQQITITPKNKTPINVTSDDYPIVIKAWVYENGREKCIEYVLMRHVTGSMRISEKREVEDV